jgi:outer membrane protein assembly factor BamD
VGATKRLKFTMKRIIVLGLSSLTFVAGCSSLPLPELPSISMPWSSTTKPDPNADAVFNRGMALFNNKKYAAAADQFTRVKQEFPFAPQAIDAELKLAESYYLNQQYPEAITAFQEFQSLHPSNENIPLVIYRLGLAHFDQFTSTDRDQKNTEIARGHFETVINNHPKSPYVAEAKQKLAKCIEYLAEHDFNVATFYFQQEKYAAARDRFEEIVRRYRGTPTAVKSLFYLGESYRKEKNGVKAALAYEAIIQHYPQSKFVNDAKTQLAELEKEKHDPLAMLLMRDRRPSSAPPAQNGAETTAIAKLKDVDNLVAKTDVVYEEPGEEKGIFRRVVDKINPFSSSDNGKKAPTEDKKTESALDMLAKKKAAEKKDESPGVLASLWPFGGKNDKDKQRVEKPKNTQLVDQIDDSLMGKGIDSKSQTAGLKPPEVSLPKVEETASPQPTDTGELLGKIDTSLKKDGKDLGELPPTPEAAEIFKDPAAAQAIAAKTTGTKVEPPPESIANSGLLGSIDDKLKSKGIEPSKFELPAPPEGANGTAPKKDPVKKVELEPKVSVEKGPLFLGPSELEVQDNAASDQGSSKEDKKRENSDKPQEPATREIPRALVRGPVQQQPVTPAPKAPEQKKSTTAGEDEEKGVLEQLKEDADNIGRILNPFRW